MKKGKLVKMSKKTIKIISNDEQVSMAVLRFLAQSEGQLTNMVDQLLRNSGYGETDTLMKIDVDGMKITINSKPQDKGSVLVVNKDKKFEEIPYSDLGNEDFYGYVQDGKMLIMQKFIQEDKVDAKITPTKDFEMMKAELIALPGNYKAYMDASKSSRNETDSRSGSSRGRCIGRYCSRVGNRSRWSKRIMTIS